MKTLVSTDSTARMRPVTMKDVAALAGVHQPVVSVVLNGAKSGTHVSDSTRERVVKAAQELGYKRNGMAAQMKTGKFGSVALLLSTQKLFSTLPLATLSGIYEELTRHDLHLSLFQLSDEALTSEFKTPKILREWMADGILVDYTHGIPPQLIETIESHQMPVVWLNTLRDDDCVRPDDYQAGRNAAQHLLNLGHRRLGYINFYNWQDPAADAINHYSGQARYRGFREVVEAAGLELPTLMRREHDIASPTLSRDSVERAQDFLAQHRPTAVASDMEAQVVLMAAQRAGLEVPRQLSVVTLGSENALFFGQPITAFQVPEFQVGQSAVQMLIKKIGDPKRKLPTQVIPFLFKPGETCAPVVSSSTSKSSIEEPTP